MSKKIAFVALRMEESMLRDIKGLAAAEGILPCSRSSLWRWIREGKFPRPQKLGDRITAWRASDVAAWLASREA